MEAPTSAGRAVGRTPTQSVSRSVGLRLSRSGGRSVTVGQWSVGRSDDPIGRSVGPFPSSSLCPSSLFIPSSLVPFFPCSFVPLFPCLIILFVPSAFSTFFPRSSSQSDRARYTGLDLSKM